MVEKDTVFEGKIKDTGIFDFKEFYGFVYNWLVDEGYFVIEKVYSEKIGPRGKDIEIIWESKKKISDYFRNSLAVSWRILGMTDVEVEEDGKKIKMNKGQVEIKVKAVLEKDYDSKWESNPIAKFLRGIYDKFIIPGRINQYEGKIYGDADEILAQAKSFLALEAKH